jgi:hypothetical protein
VPWFPTLDRELVNSGDMMPSFGCAISTVRGRAMMGLEGDDDDDDNAMVRGVVQIPREPARARSEWGNSPQHTYSTKALLSELEKRIGPKSDFEQFGWTRHAAAQVRADWPTNLVLICELVTRRCRNFRRTTPFGGRLQATSAVLTIRLSTATTLSCTSNTSRYHSAIEPNGLRRGQQSATEQAISLERRVQ